jgi:hypothetical protein
MTPDERATLIERWQQAGDDVAAHDRSQQTKLQGQVARAEAAVLEVVRDSPEPPSPTRVLEVLARRRNGVTQSAGALAIQRLVARGTLRLSSQAILEVAT